MQSILQKKKYVTISSENILEKYFERAIRKYNDNMFYMSELIILCPAVYANEIPQKRAQGNFLHEKFNFFGFFLIYRE